MDTRFFFSVSWIAPSQSDARYCIGQPSFPRSLTRMYKAFWKFFADFLNKLHIFVQLFTHLALLIEERFVLTA